MKNFYSLAGTPVFRTARPPTERRLRPDRRQIARLLLLMYMHSDIRRRHRLPTNKLDLSRSDTPENSHIGAAAASYTSCIDAIPTSNEKEVTKRMQYPFLSRDSEPESRGN